MKSNQAYYLVIVFAIALFLLLSIQGCAERTLTDLQWYHQHMCYWKPAEEQQNPTIDDLAQQRYYKESCESEGMVYGN